jgi:hypothetical protein
LQEENVIESVKKSMLFERWEGCEKGEFLHQLADNFQWKFLSNFLKA